MHAQTRKLSTVDRPETSYAQSGDLPGEWRLFAVESV
jgi:hypothetical protein